MNTYKTSPACGTLSLLRLRCTHKSCLSSFGRIQPPKSPAPVTPAPVTPNSGGTWGYLGDFQNLVPPILGVRGRFVRTWLNLITCVYTRAYKEREKEGFKASGLVGERFTTRGYCVNIFTFQTSS